MSAVVPPFTPVTINGEDFVSYSGAAAMCGCGRTRIQAAVRGGYIATVRLGRHKLLNRRDIQAWMAAQVTTCRRPAGRPRRQAA